MTISKKSWTFTLVLTVFLSIWLTISFVPIGSAQSGTNIIGILTSSATWTPVGSPYTLSGPTAVNTGVTLTIQPGVTLNLNGYYIQVNGTLIATGTASSKVQFIDGLLRFTPVSNGWNENAGTGCIIEYCILSRTSISASNALKLNQDTISRSVTVGDSSVITNDNMGSITVGNLATMTSNQISGSVTAGSACTFTSNNIGGGINAGDGCSISSNTVVGGVVCSGTSSVISDNNIQGQVTGGTITGNTITSGVSVGETPWGNPVSSTEVYVTGNVVSNNKITNGTIKATQTVNNNVVVSGIYQGQFRVFGGYATPTEDSSAIIGTGSLTISGNTITGGGAFLSYEPGALSGPSSSIIPAIDVNGATSATISNNVVTAIGGLAISGNCYLISNNVVKGGIECSASSVFNNRVNGEISLSASSWNITGNTATGISVSSGSGSISDNSITNGIGITVNSASATIENNYINGNGNNSITAIVNGTNVASFSGISVTNGAVIILNNTITSNSVGIDLYASSTATINYNNILNNNMNIILGSGMSNNVNATYNWWGTTDAQEIGQLIHDNKNDFNLGTVTTSPFLTASNPEAMPTTLTLTISTSPTNTSQTTAASTGIPTNQPTTSSSQPPNSAHSNISVSELEGTTAILAIVIASIIAIAMVRARRRSNFA